MNDMKLQREATYPYQNEKGNLLFQVVRLEPKTFRQRRFKRDGVLPSTSSRILSIRFLDLRAIANEFPDL
jgi:hypothetical protein